MTKYMNRPALTPSQEQEIFPLLDKALSLPFGKAIFYQCSKSRANYLTRTLNGEKYRNAIQSISTYLPSEPLYGKGLYYHLVIESRLRGVIIGNVESPPSTLTWRIIECAASRKPVSIAEYSSLTVLSRLNKLKERHEELRPIYIQDNVLKYAIPDPEEMLIVDIDTGARTVPRPTAEQRAKSP